MLSKEAYCFETTLGVSSKGNTKALLMCLCGVLNSEFHPHHIQIRLEGNEVPGFNDFYFEQLCALANIKGVDVQISVFKSTGVRDSRDWQLQNCKTRYMWLVDDDIVPHSRCFESYVSILEVFKADLTKEPVVFLAGSKCDVNNRRGYPHFDMALKGKEYLASTKFHNHSYRYDLNDTWGTLFPTKVLDTGNVFLAPDMIKKLGVTFRQFDEQFNPSGDATTFSLALAKAGLVGYFVPSAIAYHLEKPGGGFNEFEARGEMLLRLCDVKGYDHQIVRDWWMPK